MTPYLLLGLAIILAWPVPIILGRARWPSRAPVVAIILWQAVALAGGLSLITAPLAWGLRHYGDGLVEGFTELFRTVSEHGFDYLSTDPRMGIFEAGGVTLSAAIAVNLVLVLITLAIRSSRSRTRHRDMVAILSKPHSLDSVLPGVGPMNALVLPSHFPLAYCVPAFTGAITVISQGLIDKLSPAELKAVLDHEKAHLSQRHDLLRLAFEAWHRAVSWLSATDVARYGVSEITEMLADDAALKTNDRKDLMSAVAVVAVNSAIPGEQEDVTDQATVSRLAEPPHGLGPTAGMTGVDSFRSARLKRLIDPQPPLKKSTQWVIVLAAALLVLVPAVVTLWGI